MGWMSSWVAVKDVSPEDFPRAVQMEMTEELTWPGSKTARFYFKQRDNGWSVLFSEDFEWASR
jgi:hypothetical protein